MNETQPRRWVPTGPQKSTAGVLKGWMGFGFGCGEVLGSAPSPVARKQARQDRAHRARPPEGERDETEGTEGTEVTGGAPLVATGEGGTLIAPLFTGNLAEVPVPCICPASPTAATALFPRVGANCSALQWAAAEVLIQECGLITPPPASPFSVPRLTCPVLS